MDNHTGKITVSLAVLRECRLAIKASMGKVMAVMVIRASMVPVNMDKVAKAMVSMDKDNQATAARVNTAAQGKIMEAANPDTQFKSIWWSRSGIWQPIWTRR